MSLQFVGIDPDTETGDSPTVWVDTDKRELLLQGWTATPDEEEHIYSEAGTAPGHALGVPPHETIIRIPARMMHIIRKACDELDRSADH
ncbi:hypothetical protein [Streptomyces gibsoniae]|uniref:Uncharacterized protein n=1 Tax=Streptomyces gibsoniae TaxID=3075529 RepID=A0ABU2U2S1_9ACTN|nr:hypothetical protein [Streptomyces sp. DSM 41699]MDT0467526.1 hypothetical protein [Streptomyces sp. DSM 41699]